MKRTRVKVGLLNFEYEASLSIEHPQLEPDLISQTLKRTPARSHRLGDARRTPAQRPLDGVYETGYWSVDLETRDGEDVAQFLSRVADDLHPAKDFLRNIVDDNGRIECFVGLFAQNLCDQIIPAPILLRLGQLGVDLRLDYYDVSNVENVNSGLQVPSEWNQNCFSSPCSPCLCG